MRACCREDTATRVKINEIKIINGQNLCNQKSIGVIPKKQKQRPFITLKFILQKSYFVPSVVIHICKKQNRCLHYSLLSK
jgi:hypothetical protein